MKRGALNEDKKVQGSDTTMSNKISKAEKK
ncbi:MAG: hypothetical protein JWR18_1433 [Segetibacter sp.]|jgi:hypothetical protein|nr:hypothetical protein [Segetibacter sp.]